MRGVQYSTLLKFLSTLNVSERVDFANKELEKIIKVLFYLTNQDIK